MTPSQITLIPSVGCFTVHPPSCACPCHWRATARHSVHKPENSIAGNYGRSRRVLDHAPCDRETVQYCPWSENLLTLQKTRPENGLVMQQYEPAFRETINVNTLQDCSGSMLAGQGLMRLDKLVKSSSTVYGFSRTTDPGRSNSFVRSVSVSAVE